jgi:Ethanolamine utilization protein EutJ (predicted chaperonin)
MWAWLSEFDWPILLPALAVSLITAEIIRKARHMAGEVEAVQTKIDAVVKLIVAVQQKVQDLHMATASSIDPASVQTLADHLQTAVIDPLNAIVATPAPPVGSAPPQTTGL